jgi:hypothetical protein
MSFGKILCCGKLFLEGLDDRLFEGLDTSGDAPSNLLLHDFEGWKRCVLDTFGNWI